MGKNEQMAEDLARKIAKKGISQAEAARQIGISSASVSMILSGKHENLSGVWAKVQIWMGLDGGWKTAETANFLMIQDLCTDAQRLSQARAVSFKPGSGKTHAAKHYASNHPEVFYINCESSMSKPRLLKVMCKTMGLQESWNMEEMLDGIIEKLGAMERPLLIFDEFDELSEKGLRVFKDLYNRVRCGFLLVGGVGLQKRITTGAKNAKQSYQEILSRLGGEFIPLHEISLKTVAKICQANGLAENDQVETIFKESAGDLRAVKALLEAIKIQQNAN
jgi:DNA transposition AAA+ family ATPase